MVEGGVGRGGWERKGGWRMKVGAGYTHTHTHTHTTGVEEVALGHTGGLLQCDLLMWLHKQTISARCSDPNVHVHVYTVFP